jgi:CubicO group peptidase (beta-lactamase class C family)
MMDSKFYKSKENEMAHKKRIIIMIIFFTFCCSVDCFASNNPNTRKFQLKIEAFLQNLPQYKKFSGVILVQARGENFLRKGYGYANIGFDILNTPDTKFWIGSITKGFTTILIMQLAEENRINLDDNISQYLSLFDKSKGNKITIRHLLSHTSGIQHHFISFPDYFKKHDRLFYSPIELENFISGVELVSEPGERKIYSSLNYNLLGLIIESIYQKSYAEVIAEKILIPLGLKDSGVENNRGIKNHMAVGYLRGLKGFIHSPYGEMSPYLAAGDMYSTATDLAMFLESIDVGSGKLLQDNTKKKILTEDLGFIPFKVAVSHQEKMSGIRFGGSAYGFQCMADRLTEIGSNIIALSNMQSPYIVDEIAQKIRIQLLETLNLRQTDRESSTASKTNKVKSVIPDDLTKYCGFYMRDNKEFLSITTDNRQLILNRFDFNNFVISKDDLLYSSPEKYFFKTNPKIVCNFKKNPSRSDYKLVIYRGSEKLYEMMKIGTAASSIKEYTGSYCSSELQKTYKFKSRNGRLWVKDFLDYPLAEFVMIEKDMFGFQDMVLIFERTKGGNISSFKLMRADLDVFFGSKFIRI